MLLTPSAGVRTFKEGVKYAIIPAKGVVNTPCVNRLHDGQSRHKSFLVSIRQYICICPCRECQTWINECQGSVFVFTAIKMHLLPWRHLWREPHTTVLSLQLLRRRKPVCVFYRLHREEAYIESYSCLFLSRANFCFSSIAAGIRISVFGWFRSRADLDACFIV